LFWGTIRQQFTLDSKFEDNRQLGLLVRLRNSERGIRNICRIRHTGDSSEKGGYRTPVCSTKSSPPWNASLKLNCRSVPRKTA